MSDTNISKSGDPLAPIQGPKEDNCEHVGALPERSDERFIAVIPFVDLADDSPGFWMKEIPAATIEEAWARLSSLENGPEADLLDELIGSEIYGLPAHHHYQGPSYLSDYGLRVGDGQIHRLSKIPVANLKIDPNYSSEQSSPPDAPAPNTATAARLPSPVPVGASQLDPYSSWICNNGLSVRENVLRDVDSPGLSVIDMMRMSFCRKEMQDRLAPGKGREE